MLSDKRIAKMTDFEDSQVCFPGVDIAGGICYFLWDKQHFDMCKYKSYTAGTYEESICDLNQFIFFIK